MEFIAAFIRHAIISESKQLAENIPVWYERGQMFSFSQPLEEMSTLSLTIPPALPTLPPVPPTLQHCFSVLISSWWYLHIVGLGPSEGDAVASWEGEVEGDREGDGEGETASLKTTWEGKNNVHACRKTSKLFNTNLTDNNIASPLTPQI